MFNTNPVRDQALSVPGLIAETYQTIESSTRSALTTPEIYSIKNLILTGSGDSYNAGCAAAMAFSQLGHLWVRAETPMETSRYIAGVYVPKPEKNTLVIGVSGSGEGARVVEAITAMRASGCRTLALTANLMSRLGKAAEKALHVETPPFAPAPGVRGFITSAMALYLLAIRFGEVKLCYTMDAANVLRKQLRSCADALSKAFVSLKEAMIPFAHEIARCGVFEILASGPARAAADFGAAKLLEMMGLYTAVADVEEFNHLNFFRTRPNDIPTLLLCPKGSRAQRRCEEIAVALRVLKRPYRILTGPSGFEEHEDAVWRIPADVPELFSPLVQSTLMAFMASFVPMPEGEAYYHGHAGPWNESAFKSIKNSEIIL
ncbi:MAG: glucosamine--fructose-6-phosphate aminotransferase [Firmicutes bacterium ADurb.Bin182]|nr:MAG: glucosamine--fructose-6-phosphate aminotransferase [Firmicutes bacterium ADurb.Bin182]